MSIGKSSIKVIGLCVAAVIVAVGYFLPESEGLTHEGILSIAILVGCVLLWICESLPMGVAGLLALVAGPLLGLVPIASAFTGFGTTTFIFAVAVFGLTAIVMKSDLATRITKVMVSWSGASSNKLILAFMAATALLSTVMNDSAVLVLFLGFAYIVLGSAKHTIGKSRLAKSLFIGIAFAAFIGGGITPAGSSLNVLVIGMIEQATGNTVPFLSWMVACGPVCIVMIPICWFAIIKILKPEPIDESALVDLNEKAAALGKKLSLEEKKTLVFLIGMPVLWIVGTWVPLLNVTTVCIIGLAAMTAPGIGVLTFDEFQKSVPWTICIMIGAVLSLGGMVSATGGVMYLANLFLNTGVTSLGVFGSLLVIFLVIYFAHTLIPIGPAFAALFTPPLMAFCIASGVSPAVPGMVLAIILSGSLLVPFNPGMALAYRDNCFTPLDLFKTGIIPALIFLVLLSAWVPFASNLLQIAM
ncbi:MAG: SLC13 family permease [Coriobacteriia bacterium]|nr:SLC13 family permease [Coriobacteriia bacterium]